MNQASPDLYERARSKALEIESELKRLCRWCDQPPSPDKFENMGAFGSNTLSFEQWLQFVLLPRISDIISQRGQFPDSSAIATYAVRYFDGDSEAENLHEILYQFDELINNQSQQAYQYPDIFNDSSRQAVDSVSLADETIPSVIYTLAGLLKEFEGDALESQLQTFDTFLAVLAPSVRPAVSKLLRDAAQSCAPAGRARIEKAADAVARGERAAEPYDHDKAMKKYMEEFSRSYKDTKS